MGTNAKQIATQTDVNNKRINAFSEGTRCPTKEEIEKVEFLEVNDRTSSTNASFNAINSYFGWNDDIYMSVTNGSSSASDMITDSDCYYSGGAISCISNNYISPNTSSLTTVECGGTWPSTAAQAKYCAISKRTFTVPIGQYINLDYAFYLYGVQSTDSSGVNTILKEPYNYSWNIGIMITDSSDTHIITILAPGSTTGNSRVDTLTFTSNYSSINVYVITPYVRVSYYPSSAYYHNGFKINSSMTLTYYESYYDQTYKCVQYQDISHKSGATFTIYYGVWNNKSSNAKLDNVHVEIKKQSDSSWTTIGTTAIGTVDKSKTGTITCTLPTNFNPAVLYDLRVVCGATTYNQNWKYRWGISSTLTSSGYPWTTYSSSAKTGVCGPTSLNNSDGTSVLANDYYSTVPGLHRGRSTTYAALFQIT